MRVALQFQHFNPRPPRGGRHEDPDGGDTDGEEISIHAPREGGDLMNVSADDMFVIFQSTPPARGATTTTRPLGATWKYFNPRPPRGGRRAFNSVLEGYLIFQSTPPARGATSLVVDTSQYKEISIHAPREGGDQSLNGRFIVAKGFQSTPPARGATPS